MSARPWSVALLILVVAGPVAGGGCARGPHHRPGTEYLKKIEVEGNRQVSDRKLVSGLALQRAKRRGRAPDPYLVQLDEDRIRGEYLRRGFLGIDVHSRVERAGDAAIVVYKVEEGTRARTRVTINGIPADAALSPAAVRAKLPLADGDPFDYAVYEAAKPRLLGAALDAGYAHAKLDATVYADRGHGEAVIQLDYDLGPRCTFGTVELSGVDGPLADAVRARVQFAPGDRYSQRAISATQRELYAMARFSTVQVQPSETAGSVVGVKIALSEAARREVRLGGGFGVDPTAYEIRGRAGYSIAGWPFPLDTVTLDLRPAYAYLRDGGWQPRIRASAKLTRQDLLWTYARGEVEAGYNYIAVEAYTSYGPNARLAFATPVVSRRLQLGLGWTFQVLGFRQISDLIAPMLAEEIGLVGTERIGAYTQSLTLDLRDHPIEPRLGAYGEVRVAEGTPFAGGKRSYLQLVPEIRGYVPLGPVVLAARARAGRFFGDAPATERFFAGGASSHRGFGERRLAPFSPPDANPEMPTVPYGGTVLLETGVEARIPITTWRDIGIGTVVFLDGGDVRDEPSQLDVGNLHWAAGLGLRFKTLVGPVRADLGYRLNRTGMGEPSPDSRFAFHLSLGEAF